MKTINSVDVEAANLTIKACIENAEQLLESAKEIHAHASRGHIAYHLAVLALEEVGKAHMILMSSLTPESRASDEDHRSPADVIDDHEKKLFWALWSPIFGKKLVEVEKFRECQHLAKGIHETRLESLYVDPRNPTRISQPSTASLDAIFKLVEARLEMDRMKQVRELDQNSREHIEWMFQSFDKPELQGMIFGQSSLAKLEGFNGDVKKWISWLRDSIGEMERNSREIMEREMNRGQAEGMERHLPKWQVNIRLSSWSHSMRAKPLSEWNKRSRWIKFFPNTGNKQEILVQFTLFKAVPVQALWSGGMQVSWMIVLAFNIGTVGFFWWYLPKFVSRFYEQILDLENTAKVIVERTPPLTIAWPHQALMGPQLANISAVLAHLMRIDERKRAAYNWYFQSLGLLAKNDVFGQLEQNIVVGFFEAFRAGMRAYDDWSGKPEEFEAAVQDRVLSSLSNSQLANDLLETLRLGARLTEQKMPDPKVTLNEVAKMKVYCDVYFIQKATKEIASREDNAATKSKGGQNPLSNLC